MFFLFDSCIIHRDLYTHFSYYYYYYWFIKYFYFPLNYSFVYQVPTVYISYKLVSHYYSCSCSVFLIFVNPTIHYNIFSVIFTTIFLFCFSPLQILSCIAPNSWIFQLPKIIVWFFLLPTLFPFKCVRVLRLILGFLIKWLLLNVRKLAWCLNSQPGGQGNILLKFSSLYPLVYKSAHVLLQPLRFLPPLLPFKLLASLPIILGRGPHRAWFFWEVLLLYPSPFSNLAWDRHSQVYFLLLIEWIV